MKTLLIDIEAAPAKAYIWDLKTRYVPISQIAEDGYILCFAFRWLGDPQEKTYYYTLWDHGHDTMIEAAWELLNEADHVITYNGTSYDLPRLNTEFLIQELGPPRPYHHTDVFVATRKFRTLSKSMNHYLKLLDLDLKVEHKGFALWTGCMDGVKEDQADMVEYNCGDVVALEQLYTKLYPWLDNVPNEALWMAPTTEPRCRCGSTDLRFKGYKRTKVLSYKQYHCNECGSWMKQRQAEETGPRVRKDVLTW